MLLVILAITHSRQKEKSKLRLKLEKQIEADVEWDEGAEKGDMNLEGKWEWAIQEKLRKKQGLILFYSWRCIKVIYFLDYNGLILFYSWWCIKVIYFLDYNLIPNHKTDTRYWYIRSERYRKHLSHVNVSYLIKMLYSTVWINENHRISPKVADLARANNKANNRQTIRQTTGK